LLVDDDPRVRQLFNDCLTRFGHEVHAVENGATALARLETEHYDVVLTDLLMPGMSGLEVAEMVRALHPALPIIVATGSASGQDRQRLQDQGVALLRKPFPLAKLAETVRTALGHRGRPDAG
jgi:two-component system OmpR family response regulator